MVMVLGGVNAMTRMGEKEKGSFMPSLWTPPAGQHHIPKHNELKPSLTPRTTPGKSKFLLENGGGRG
jgi:hypothetical protein